MSGPGEEDHVEVILLDHAAEVQVHEGETGARSPVAKLAVLDVLGAQRLGQQRVLAKVDHAEAEVVAGAPPDLDAAEFVRAEGFAGDGGAGGGVGT